MISRLATIKRADFQFHPRAMILMSFESQYATFLMISSNLGLISYRFRDRPLARFPLKNDAHCSYLSFSFNPKFKNVAFTRQLTNFVTRERRLIILSCKKFSSTIQGLTTNRQQRDGQMNDTSCHKRSYGRAVARHK